MEMVLFSMLLQQEMGRREITSATLDLPASNELFDATHLVSDQCFGKSSCFIQPKTAWIGGVADKSRQAKLLDGVGLLRVTFKCVGDDCPSNAPETSVEKGMEVSFGNTAIIACG